jgi:hypothetical protein
MNKQRAEARAKPTEESLWRDAILDQLVDAQCAIRDAMLSYARECIVNALAMLDDACAGKPSRLILDVHLKS